MFPPRVVGRMYMVTTLIILVALIAVVVIWVRRRPVPDPTKKPREHGEYLQLILEKWDKIRWVAYIIALVLIPLLALFGYTIGEHITNWNCQNPRSCADITDDNLQAIGMWIGIIAGVVALVSAGVLDFFVRAINANKSDRD